MDAVVSWLSLHWTGLAGLGGMVYMASVWGYQHRLMWRDYRRYHKINGDTSEKARGRGAGE